MSKSVFSINNLQNISTCYEFVKAFSDELVSKEWNKLLEKASITATEPSAVISFKSLVEKALDKLLTGPWKKFKDDKDIRKNFLAQFENSTSPQIQSYYTYLNNFYEKWLIYRKSLFLQKTNCGLIEVDDAEFWPSYKFEEVFSVDTVSSEVLHQAKEKKSILYSSKKINNRTFISYTLESTSGLTVKETISENIDSKSPEQIQTLILNHADAKGHTRYTPRKFLFGSPYGAYVIINKTNKLCRKTIPCNELVYVTQEGKFKTIGNSEKNSEMLDAIYKHFPNLKIMDPLNPKNLEFMTKITQYDRSDDVLLENDKETQSEKMSGYLLGGFFLTFFSVATIYDPALGLSYLQNFGALLAVGFLAAQLYETYLSYTENEIDFGQLLFFLTMGAAGAVAGYFLCKLVVLPLLVTGLAALGMYVTGVGAFMLYTGICALSSALATSISRETILYLLKLSSGNYHSLPGSPKTHVLSREQKEQLTNNGENADKVQIALLNLAAEQERQDSFYADSITRAQDKERNKVTKEGKIGDFPSLFFAACKTKENDDEDDPDLDIQFSDEESSHTC